MVCEGLLAVPDTPNLLSNLNQTLSGNPMIKISKRFLYGFYMDFHMEVLGNKNQCICFNRTLHRSRAWFYRLLFPISVASSGLQEIVSVLIKTLYMCWNLSAIPVNALSNRGRILYGKCKLILHLLQSDLAPKSRMVLSVSIRNMHYE